MSISNHVTVGVYSNHTHVTNIVRPEDLVGHIEYNRVMRFGRALFVDGVCVHKGYLNEKDIAEWTKIIAGMTFNKMVASNQYY